jgi:hypothetical protein
MTLQELNRNIRVHDELTQDYELLESLRAKASPSSPNLDSMPHGTGVSDKVATLAIAITDIEYQINRLTAESKDLTEKVEMYLGEVRSTKVRTAMRLRYISCLSWKEVADTMGRFYTAESAQKMVYTYLHKQGAIPENYGQCTFL